MKLRPALLPALGVFVAAARHQNFAHAADELHLTASAVSHHIRKLEALLGATLFHRHARGVRLTVEGRQLADAAGAALDDIAAVAGNLHPDPDAAPLFVTGTVHNMVHLTTGFLALYIAFATVGRAQADAVIGFGVLYLVVAVLLFLSPNLFGILGPSPGYNANAMDQLLHLALGFVSIAVGVVARRELATG